MECGSPWTHILSSKQPEAVLATRVAARLTQVALLTCMCLLQTWSVCSIQMSRRFLKVCGMKVQMRCTDHKVGELLLANFCCYAEQRRLYM